MIEPCARSQYPATRDTTPAAPRAAFTALPQTGFALETDTALAAQSRLKIFDKVSADGLLIAGSHIHFPGFGRIVKAGDAYRFAATTW